MSKPFIHKIVLPGLNRSYTINLLSERFITYIMLLFRY